MLTKSKKYIMHKGILSLIFAFALSVPAILSPLVRAEESSGYTWKDIIIPGDGNVMRVGLSRDGLKLFAIRKNYDTGKVKLYVSADDGMNWDSFDMPDDSGWYISSNTDGSKLLIEGGGVTYLSTNGGRNWSTLSTPMSGDYGVFMSPDGSTLARCGQWSAPLLYVSVDNGQTWVQKGNKCPSRIFNGGKMVYRDYTRSFLEWSTDYGVTWSVIKDEEVRDVVSSDDAKSMTDGWKVSLDGGSNWAGIPEHPSELGNTTVLGAISNDGKKMIATFYPVSPDDSPGVMSVSVDGGKTWQKWNNENIRESSLSMSADGSRLFVMASSYPKSVYRLATLPRPQPVTPGGTGSGTSGAATPSAGSSSSGASTTAASSSTSNKKPEKSSSTLAETGNSIWLVSGLAVIAVVAGGLALRKRP